MPVAVLSDVHSNIEALRATIEDARGLGVDSFVCLGDVVGYNTFLTKTIDLLRYLKIPCVQGNHDLMAVGRLEPHSCGPNARRAIQWTREILAQEERDFLLNLPPSRLLNGETLLVHSALGDPAIYLRTDDHYREARRVIGDRFPEVRICLTGHTHVAMVIEVDTRGDIHRRGRSPFHLRPGSFYFLNPGSVGHPRQGDYRASYLLYDSDDRRVVFRKVAYDRQVVVAENLKNGIHTDLGPSVLLHRLNVLRGSIAAIVDWVRPAQ